MEMLSAKEFLSNSVEMELLQPFGLQITAKKHTSFTSVVESKLLKMLTQRYKIIILRNFSEVNKEGLVDYAKSIGPLLEWEFGNVMEMRAHEEPKNYLFTHGPVPFHWDGAFHQEPRYLLFHCIEAPNKAAGGETFFSNTNQIWQDASQVEKESWSRLKLTYKTEKLAHYGGRITVPFVQNHPDTHEKILRFAEPVPSTMLNPVDVSVEDTHQADANQFIVDMTARCYSNKNCYVHTWEKNDFLMADNYALLHRRHAFKEFSARHLRRIQVL